MSGQWKLVPVEPTETMVINGFESEPDECFSDEEVWEQYQGMSGCQQAAFRAKLCWAAMLASAPAAPEADAKSVCDHEWTDDGEFLLVCTKCGTHENHDPKWRDMESAPKDGTLLRLLVSFDEHSTEDADEAPTIGANNFDNDGEDVWRFAGWCWTHDHFTQGVGTPVGWLPMIEASASTDKLDRVTAERDALQQRLNAADQRIDELTQRKAEPVEWGAPKTVRQLIRQLETLDQDLRPLSMLRVPGKVFEDGKDRTRAVHLSFSHERVEGQWLAPFKGDGEKVVAFWCRMEQPATVFGFPVVVDQGMAPNEMRLVQNAPQRPEEAPIKGMIAARGGEYAIMIDENNGHYGWTFRKDPNGMWVSGRKATDAEMQAARQYARHTNQQ